MLNQFDAIITNLLNKIPGVRPDPNNGSHIAMGVNYSLINVIAIHSFSAWFWLGLPLYLAAMLYKEFIQDEHLVRWFDELETLSEKQDLISDIITKSLGLVCYLAIFLL